MRAITYNPNNKKFSLSTVKQPTPAENQVLVKVTACGLNPVDAKISQWQHMVPNMDDSWVAGLDVVGEIVQLGQGVKGWQIGDKVICHGDMLKPHGGLAEYCIQDAKHLLPDPVIDDALAAAIPCAGWTAWRALVDKLDIGDRKSILITGGSGGVGSFAIQIAKFFGVKQIITTCSAQNTEYVSKLGATDIIDYKQQNIVDEVMKLTSGQGVEVGLDTVGGDNDIYVANSLSFEGEMVELVQTIRPEAYQDSFLRGLSFHQLSLGSGLRNGFDALTKTLRAGKAMTRCVLAGDIAVPVNTISLEQVPETLENMLNQRTVGKIVAVL
ncbi:zinc-binding dehydrogenase [Catenovulum sp. SM1970]|uniref:alcohol dehydrogenase catalytic domain-containing protein n=1 Tax=Marinifaba aquimaris TaxID=2741323 RepID=UPI0015746A00|nr:zinc-binding dehydrogenase [Marinifaba aquimaris]NTS75775.1 zinc-binding dehydrogenase [Marinifaba aquimaris]